MTEELRMDETAPDDVMPDVADTPDADGTAPAETETEARARRLGWVPKDQFRGPAGKWVEADAFVERVEQETPVLRERLRSMDRKVAEMERTMNEFAAYHRQTEQRAYERAVKHLRTEMRRAAEDGDMQRYDTLSQQADTLIAEARQVGPTQRTQDEAPPEALAFVERNPWWNKDEEMQAYAIARHGRLLREKPGMSLEENLEQVEADVRRRFADRFGNPRRSQPAAVESGAPTGRRSARAKSYEALPPDAKAACDRYVKQGLLTKDQYVKEFFAE